MQRVFLISFCLSHFCLSRTWPDDRPWYAGTDSPMLRPIRFGRGGRVRPAFFSPDLDSNDGSVQPLTGLGVEELHLPGVELERHEVTGRKATPGWELAH